MTPSLHQSVSSASTTFTDMCDKNMQLVKAIEKFPCIYNFNLPEYLKKDTSDKAWHEVASQTQLTVAECKEKWKHLRYGLLRSLRPYPDGTAKRRYYLHDEMEFVLPYIRSSSRHHEIVLQQIEVETDDEATVHNDHNKDQNVEIPEPPRKKFRTNYDNFIKYLDQRSNNNNDKVCDDSRKMFLLSLLPEVNALTEYQMRMFRRKILSLLDEIVDSQSLYEMTLLQQWQKESNDELNEDAKLNSQNDVIKQELL